MDLPAGRVDEKFLSWLLANRENYSQCQYQLAARKKRGQSSSWFLQAMLARRSVLRAEQRRGSRFASFFLVTYRRARGQLPQSHRRCHCERSKKSGVTRLRPRKNLKQQWLYTDSSAMLGGLAAYVTFSSMETSEKHVSVLGYLDQSETVYL
ncbi:hypothetical protein CI102_13392 [Trichoderma harzianum]|nr:hypothetical protein CI102_13392 [Trichoderma harzianum]